MQEKDRSPPAKQELVEISIVDLFKYLYSHRIFLAVVAVSVTLLLAGWVTLMNSPRFRSSTIFQVVTEDNLGAIQIPNFDNFFDEKKVSKKMYVLESIVESRQYKKALYEEVFGQGQIIGSTPELVEQKKRIRDHFSEIVGTVKAKSDEVTGKEAESRQDILSGSLSLSREKENDTLIVSAITTSPEVSQALSSVAGRMLLAVNFNNNLSQVRAIKSFLEKLTGDTKTQLLAIESELTNLQVEEKSFSLQEISVYYDKGQIEAKTKLRELKSRFHSNEVLLSQFKTELKTYITEMKSGTPSYLYLMQLQKKIDLLKYQIQVNNNERLPASNGSGTAESTVASAADSKVQLNQLIQDFEKELGRNQNDWSMNSWDYWQSLEKNVSELKSKQKILRGEIEAQENALHSEGKDFEKYPQKIQKLTELRREIEMTQKLYGELQAKLQETQVREAGQKNNLQLVYEPEVASRPEGFRLVSRLLMSVAVGLGLAMGLLLIRYFFIPTLRSKQDLVRMHLNCIAEIPRSSQAPKLAGKDKSLLVIDESARSPEATAFRNFRFRIERILAEESIGTAANSTKDSTKNSTTDKEERCAKVATFFSINSDEGKTFTVANLGTALSLVGKKVLLIDLDYRKPELSSFFPNVKKIYLNRSASDETPVHFEHFNAAKNLQLLRSYPNKENFSDWLESRGFEDLLGQLRTRYDMILIDTPPMDRNFEAVVASKFSDMMIMVVNQRSTLREDIVKLDQSVREVYKGPIYSVLNFAYDELKGAA